MTIALDFKNRITKEKRIAAIKASLDKKQTQDIAVKTDDIAKFELLITSLASDIKRLTDLPQGSARSNCKKNELVPRYLPYVENYLARDEVFKNPVLVQCMIWCFDVHDINNALRLANICIEQKQSMPTQYTRTLHVFIADSFREWCEHCFRHNESIEPYFSEMLTKVMDWPIHDAIKCGYYKIAAEQAEKNADYEKALELYLLAEKTDEKAAKVKTTIAKLRKLIEKKLK